MYVKYIYKLNSLGSDAFFYKDFFSHLNLNIVLCAGLHRHYGLGHRQAQRGDTQAGRGEALSHAGEQGVQEWQPTPQVWEYRSGSLQLR